jgi:hypothetical protein
MRSVLLTLFTLLLGMSSLVQAQSDICHVYVVDIAKAQAAHDSADEKLMAGAQVVFPDFKPTIAEEELTTKTYQFPKSKSVITASVFYTDESIVSATGADSILVAVVVSAKAQQNAIMATGNAVAEVGYTLNRNTVRAKKYTMVDGRFYVVGIECRCNEKRDAP